MPDAPAAEGPKVMPLNPEEKVVDWKIIRTLGAGAFGEVYLVEKKGKEYAMKTERADSKVRVLKMEVVVLTALQKSGATHCCDLVDSGKSRGFCYIVMSLVGRALQDLRKMSSTGYLTMGCAISVGMQCLEAVQELHNCGYLHRDIKPANFAIAIDDPRRVYVLDFGMCRRYLDSNNKIRYPRAVAGFRGTLRYAPFCCHVGIEISRKDDLESWFYQQMEITSGSLPWSHLFEFELVLGMKEDFRKRDTRVQMLGNCPKEYIHIIDYIDGLGFVDDPNYALIRGLLRDALTINKLNEYPYDWEKTARSPPPDKK